MCFPAMGLIGAAVSAVGSIAQANAAANAANYNASVEKINARSRRQEGQSEREDLGRKYDKVSGTQTTAYSGAGVDPFYGSALKIFEDTEFSRGVDMDRSYTGAESRATAHENKAKQYEYEAKSQRAAGMISAVGSLFGGLKGGLKGGAGGLGATLRIS